MGRGCSKSFLSYCTVGPLCMFVHFGAFPLQLQVVLGFKLQMLRSRGQSFGWGWRWVDVRWVLPGNTRNAATRMNNTYTVNDTQLGCSRHWQWAGSRALSYMHVMERAIVSWPRRCCSLCSTHDNPVLAHRLSWYLHVPAFRVMTFCGKLSLCLGHHTVVFVEEVIDWYKFMYMDLVPTSCKLVKSKAHAQF